MYMFRYLLTILTGLMLCCCNKDDVIEQNPQQRLPEIHFYEGRVDYAIPAGEELTIMPEYINCSNARYQWCVDDVVISTEPNLVYSWNEAGRYYVSITATTPAGSVSEEVSVEVSEAGAPIISLPLASESINVLVGTEYRINAEISGSSAADFAVEWSIDGTLVSDTPLLTFTPEATGFYSVEIKATNRYGSATRNFTLVALDKLPIDIRFPSQSYFATSTTRYTFAHRPVCLTPIIESGAVESLSWSVDGNATDCTDATYVFTPEAPGQHTVAVTVNGSVTASVVVVCVDATEQQRYRRATASSSATADRVYEWCPAPGQFIGETSAASDQTTLESACQWALSRLNRNMYVSLGGFGGYIIVGFDHSIPAGASGYDFCIQGNAYLNAITGNGGSNEPGIVYVMQDINGNGLPDDEWYELDGSESASADTWRDYAVTYYRPAGSGMNVNWTDNRGGYGVISYMPSFHSQPSYYPAWIDADSYTLRGTRLQTLNIQDAITGMWNTMPRAWGYADNMGSDLIDSNDVYSNTKQLTGFMISHAMLPNRTPIKLEYIDFIKVQTGVNASISTLGEVSTEILGFTDLSIDKQR